MIKSFFVSICLSAFVYLEYFQIDIKILDTILALYGFYSLFSLSKKELFFVGFFSSILWLWWIAKSFVYYDLSYLIPLVLLGIGGLYGVMFTIIGLSDNLLYKGLAIFGLSFIEPFGFGWFKLELPFINSYFGTSKIEFIGILLLVALLHYQKFSFRYRVVASSIVFCFLFGYNFYPKDSISKPPLKIYKYNTNIPQEHKWDSKYINSIVNQNIKTIQTAISQKYDMIVLPETAFSLVLNKQLMLINSLKRLSDDITIVTGALSLEDGKLFNSTYIFDKGSVRIIHKFVLVPFGEAVPLPQKIKKWINDTFYDGAEDYEVASTPTTFEVKGVKFRNAICYETTTDEIYHDLDTHYVISISNNAWFTPSIEPTLQNLLMRYYSEKYSLYYIKVENKF